MKISSEFPVAVSCREASLFSLILSMLPLRIMAFVFSKYRAAFG